MEIFVKRATAYMVSGKTDLARKDLDVVLAKDPTNLKVPAAAAQSHAQARTDGLHAPSPAVCAGLVFVRLLAADRAALSAGAAEAGAGAANHGAVR